MSSQSKSRPGRMLAMLSATVVFLCTFATFAAAQEQSAPKWELYGGYSFMHFGADVHGQLGSIVPVKQPPGSEPTRHWRQRHLQLQPLAGTHSRLQHPLWQRRSPASH